MKKVLFITALLCVKFTLVSCTADPLPNDMTKAETLKGDDGNLHIPIDEEDEPKNQQGKNDDDDCENTSTNTQA